MCYLRKKIWAAPRQTCNYSCHKTRFGLWHVITISGRFLRSGCSSRNCKISFASVGLHNMYEWSTENEKPVAWFRPRKRKRWHSPRFRSLMRQPLFSSGFRRKSNSVQNETGNGDSVDQLDRAGRRMDVGEGQGRRKGGHRTAAVQREISGITAYSGDHCQWHEPRTIGEGKEVSFIRVCIAKTRARLHLCAPTGNLRCHCRLRKILPSLSIGNFLWRTV